MKPFHKENMTHIQEIFQRETGVSVAGKGRRHAPAGRVLLAAAVLACGFALTAMAVSRFSPLNGDDFSLSAEYQGEGVIAVQVENHSEKELAFQPVLKVMRWSTAEEVPAVSNEVAFSNTVFPGGGSGTMTIDLSEAYDIQRLEQPLEDDYYYLVLTNENFVFGQDWMCTVSFAPPVETTQQETETAAAQEDKTLAQRAEEALRPYLELDLSDIDVRRQALPEYYEKCSALAGELDVRLVAPVTPQLVLEDPQPGVILDETAPADRQYLLTSLNWHTLDACFVPVGAGEEDQALVVSALLPQRKGDTDGGAPIPLIYYMAYPAEETKADGACALIRGQLVSFPDLEEKAVYRDEDYVVYQVSAFFYSDMHRYVDTMAAWRGDVYLDNQVWHRVEAIHDYYTDPEVLKDILHR